MDKPLKSVPHGHWPVRRQTYGYHIGCRAPPLFGLYQIILLGDRGTRVLATCPELLPDGAPPGSRTCDISITIPLTTTPPSGPNNSTREEIYILTLLHRFTQLIRIPSTLCVLDVLNSRHSDSHTFTIYVLSSRLDCSEYSFFPRITQNGISYRRMFDLNHLFFPSVLPSYNSWNSRK